jgi:hypothetical protein
MCTSRYAGDSHLEPRNKTQTSMMSQKWSWSDGRKRIARRCTVDQIEVRNRTRSNIGCKPFCRKHTARFACLPSTKKTGRMASASPRKARSRHCVRSAALASSTLRPSDHFRGVAPTFDSLSVEQYPAALHPKRRLGWPCELSPQHAPRVSISRRLAYPDFARACDLNARVCASWPWHFSDAYSAAHRGRRTPKNGQLRWRRHAGRLNRHLSRYSNLNSRFADSPEMWDGGQTRYAPMHLPGHVARTMNGALKVRQRFPAVRRHPHPWLRPRPMRAS